MPIAAKECMTVTRRLVALTLLCLPLLALACSGQVATSTPPSVAGSTPTAPAIRRDRTGHCTGSRPDCGGDDGAARGLTKPRSRRNTTWTKVVLGVGLDYGPPENRWHG